MGAVILWVNCLLVTRNCANRASGLNPLIAENSDATLIITTYTNTTQSKVMLISRFMLIQSLDLYGLLRLLEIHLYSLLEIFDGLIFFESDITSFLVNIIDHVQPIQVLVLFQLGLLIEIFRCENCRWGF